MQTRTSSSKRAVVYGGMMMLLACLPSESLACLDTLNPHAFQHPLANESDLLPNGMMSVIHKQETGEQIVHVSVHRIHMVLPGYNPMLPERRDPRYTVLQTDGTINPMTYVIITNALYYGTGQDALGFPTHTWIDSDEDGLNGNEKPTFHTAKLQEANSPVDQGTH